MLGKAVVKTIAWRKSEYKRRKRRLKRRYREAIMEDLREKKEKLKT